MAEQTTHIGVFRNFRWVSDEGDFIIGYLEDGTIVKGAAEEGELTPGITYGFYGKWKEHDEYGKQFLFTMFTTKQPHSRHGVLKYLERYATGIGYGLAIRIWDRFGPDSVAVLRTQPEAVAEVPEIGRYLSLEKARAAGAALAAIAALEDTKIELTTLFDRRGFPGKLVESCVQKWRILAPARIKRDPFCMLVNEMPGCGFARCDRLYTDLGLPLDRLKRQVICLWHVLHSDSSGNTWIPAELAVTRLGELMVAGCERRSVRPKRAVLLGCRSGWLARKRDSEGKLWLAEGDKARAEKLLATKLVELGNWKDEANEATECSTPSSTSKQALSFTEAST